MPKLKAAADYRSDIQKRTAAWKKGRAARVQ
jgi:hypothetical protein